MPKYTQTTLYFKIMVIIEYFYIDLFIFMAAPIIHFDFENYTQGSTAITNNNRCFYFLSIVKYFLQDINPNNNFKRDILELIKKYPETPIKFMGINVDDDGNMFDWQNEPLWQQ